ncbi:MAG TPA: META domain-containing protein [Burkholderiaceae bacterium]|nr:META domain-containing protein [Burkholderiaceae bacterium]
MNPLSSISAVLAAGLLAACTPPLAAPPTVSTQPPSSAESQQETAHPIASASWRLARTAHNNGDADPRWNIPDNHPLQLDFDARKVIVSGLCNQMAAGYTLDGQQLRFGQVTSTMRICSDDALMQIEHAVGLHLPRADKWHMPSPSELVISFDDGTTWFFNKATH